MSANAHRAETRSDQARSDRQLLDGWDRTELVATMFDQVLDLQKTWLDLATTAARMMTPPIRLMDLARLTG